MNVNKDLSSFYRDEPPGERTNAVRWLQKRVMRQALSLPRCFTTLAEWEAFRGRLRRDLPGVIGLPAFPPMGEPTVRARIRVGEDAIVERVDVDVDGDYAIPCFVFRPREQGAARMPGLVWNPGWPQDKWDRSYQEFALRMVRQGFVVLILDHAPFGETSPFENKAVRGMDTVMGLGHMLGISQLALRAAETIRAGEYIRARSDVDPQRVALSGLCQGGQDTWLVGALDERFCAVAPICSESTFATHATEMASYMMNADSSPFPFGILKVCDVEHLHAAIAPRPLLVRANLPDNWWPVSGFDQVESLTRAVYRLYGAEERVDFRAEVHEHNLTGPFADALEAFLLRYLR
jgi:dienelactone hydrolase